MSKLPRRRRAAQPEAFRPTPKSEAVASVPLSRTVSHLGIEADAIYVREFRGGDVRLFGLPTDPENKSEATRWALEVAPRLTGWPLDVLDDLPMADSAELIAAVFEALQGSVGDDDESEDEDDGQDGDGEDAPRGNAPAAGGRRSPATGASSRRASR